MMPSALSTNQETIGKSYHQVHRGRVSVSADVWKQEYDVWGLINLETKTILLTFNPYSTW